jgi:hypothetical protein
VRPEGLGKLIKLNVETFMELCTFFTSRNNNDFFTRMKSIKLAMPNTLHSYSHMPMVT